MPKPKTELVTAELATVDHLSRDQLVEQLDDLRTLSTEDLRRELARSLRLTAESLVRLALIVRSLEERGDDLRDLKISLMPYLRQIAYGQVLPEVVVRYADRPILVKAIASLPYPDQERLSTAGKIELAVRHEDGSLDHRLVDPLYLDRRQISQVFTRGRIRPPEEQIILLESQPRGRAPQPAVETLDGIKIEHKRRGLVIGRRFVPVATLVAAMAKLARPTGDDEGDRDGSFAIPLSDSERERLREAAAQGHTQMSTLARRALRSSGLI